MMLVNKDLHLVGAAVDSKTMVLSSYLIADCRSNFVHDRRGIFSRFAKEKTVSLVEKGLVHNAIMSEGLITPIACHLQDLFLFDRRTAKWSNGNMLFIVSRVVVSGGIMYQFVELEDNGINMKFGILSDVDLVEYARSKEKTVFCEENNWYRLKEIVVDNNFRIVGV